ncbi:MAG: hypothetical protein E7211_21475 [Clostridium lundense]|nr:hypothetical protein [Clostridium lundense]
MKRFVTMRQLGQILLGWAAVMAVLFLWDLLEIGEVVHIIALNMLLRPLFAAVFAIWLARRHARGVTQIDWRGVCIYLLICVILFLAFVLYDKTLGIFWLSDLFQNRWVGADSLVHPEIYSYFYDGGIRWEPRWLSYWFLLLCYLDIFPFEALAVEIAVYPIAKLICIKRQSKKRSMDPNRDVFFSETLATSDYERGVRRDI